MPCCSFLSCLEHFGRAELTFSCAVLSLRASAGRQQTRSIWSRACSRKRLRLGYPRPIQPWTGSRSNHPLREKRGPKASQYSPQEYVSQVYAEIASDFHRSHTSHPRTCQWFQSVRACPPVVSDTVTSVSFLTSSQTYSTVSSIWHGQEMLLKSILPLTTQRSRLRQR